VNDDEMANCMIVTGAIWGAVSSLPTCEEATPDGNTLTVKLDFMQSKYKITVERLDGEWPWTI
jgi:hypothetical protein